MSKVRLCQDQFYSDNQKQPAGYHSIEFEASGLASGVYLDKLEAGEYVEVRKMILMK